MIIRKAKSQPHASPCIREGAPADILRSCGERRPLAQTGRAASYDRRSTAQALRRYQGGLKKLRNVTRADLGSAELEDEVTF
jgi:hypothetical protein